MSASRPTSALTPKMNGTHTATSPSGNSTPRTPNPNDTSSPVSSSITSASRPTTATRSTSRPTSAKPITPQRSPSNAALIRGSGTTTPLSTSTSTSDSTAVALVSPRLASTTSIPGTIVAPEVIPRGALTLGVRPAIEEISRVRSNHRASTRAFLAHLQREIDQLAISLHDDGDSEDENDENMLQQLIEMRTAMENKISILDQQRNEELLQHKKELVQAHTRAKLSHQEVRSLQALQRDLVKAGGDPVMLQHVTQFTNYRQEEERRRKYDEYIAKRVQKPTPSRALRDDSSSAPVPSLTSPSSSSSSSLSTTTTVIRPRPDTDPAALAARERHYMEKQAQIRRDEREHKRLEEERRLRELTRQREKREAEAKERYDMEMERRRKAEAELDIKMKAEEEEEKSAGRLASEIAALKEQEWGGEGEGEDEEDEQDQDDEQGDEQEPYLDDEEEPEPENQDADEYVKAAPSKASTKSPRPHPAGDFSPRPKPGKMTFAAEAPITSSNQRFVRAKMRHAAVPRK